MNTLPVVAILLLGSVDNIFSLRCFQCENTTETGECRNFDKCQIDEVCYVEHWVDNSYNLRYNRGCQKKEVCMEYKALKSSDSGGVVHPSTIITGNLHRRNSVLQLCYMCCEESFCNFGPCNVTVYPTVEPTTSGNTLITSFLPDMGCNDILEEVFIILDMTKYFTQEEQNRTIDFVRNLIYPMDLMESSARVKLAFSSNSFSSTTLLTYMKYQLNKDLDEFKVFPSGGDTRLKYALKDILHSIRSQQVRPGASVKVVAFVDGLSDYFDAISVAGELKKERAEVNILYMKSSNKTSDLQAIASSPAQSHMFGLTTPDSLQQVDEMYLQRDCFKCKETEAIYFVVDMSESIISSPNIDFLLGFLKIATYGLDIRDDGSKIALLAFDGLKVTEVVEFGTYASKQDFIHSLGRIRNFTVNKRSDSSDINVSLIKSAANGTATVPLGGRKLALIITDGTSKNHTAFLEYVERTKIMEGIEIFVIGVSYTGMLGNLHNVASEHKDDHLIQVQSLLQFLRYPNVTLLQNRRCASDWKEMFISLKGLHDKTTPHMNFVSYSSSGVSITTKATNTPPSTTVSTNSVHRTTPSPHMTETTPQPATSSSSQVTASSNHSLLCYSCNEVNNPADCHQIARCQRDHACFFEEVVTDTFETKFSSRCVSGNVCHLLTLPDSSSPTLVGKRNAGNPRSTMFHICASCCYHDLCNNHICKKIIFRKRLLFHVQT